MLNKSRNGAVYRLLRDFLFINDHLFPTPFSLSLTKIGNKIVNDTFLFLIVYCFYKAPDACF